MIKEEQELQSQNKNKYLFFKNLSTKTKLFFSSLVILVLGFFAIKSYKKKEHDNDEEFIDSNNKINENNKDIEKVEKSISLYKKEIESISREINHVMIDIKNIESKKEEETTLDNFFDERVK